MTDPERATDAEVETLARPMQRSAEEFAMREAISAWGRARQSREAHKRRKMAVKTPAKRAASPPEWRRTAPVFAARQRAPVAIGPSIGVAMETYAGAMLAMARTTAGPSPDRSPT
jgi:hypothetical protein